MSRDDLLLAYRTTRYVAIDAGREVVARVGLPSPEVDDLLRRHRADAAAFITAWNPRSVPQPPAVNEAAHTRLAAELDAAGVRWLPQRGEGDDPVWPPEQGVLALDLDEASATAVALRHRQNALVMIATGAAPRLVLTALMGDGR